MSYVTAVTPHHWVWWPHVEKEGIPSHAVNGETENRRSRLGRTGRRGGFKVSFCCLIFALAWTFSGSGRFRALAVSHNGNLSEPYVDV